MTEWKINGNPACLQVLAWRMGKTMNVLMVGDVVGPGGCQFLKERLYRLKKEYAIDVTIVNGENSAKGNGITERSARDLLSCGADVLTTGNHCFQRREALGIYEQDTILRPANYPEGCPGKGVCVLDLGAVQLAVLNLSGTAYLDPLDNPFTKVEQMLQELDTPNIFVDFHAEATAEKKAMGYFLAGRVTAVVGTHTHVQTADACILSGHTGYITDVGMTGPEESILGVAVQPALDRFRFRYAARFQEAETACFLNAVVLSFNEKCGKCTKIEPLIIR